MLGQTAEERPTTQRTQRAATGRWIGLPLVLAVTLLWRFPSWLDPPWVNDEGTYFAVAQAMAHGRSLYVGVWENKPPALYLLYAAVYHWAGPSLLTIRVIATVCVLLIAVLTAGIARRFVSGGQALLAALIAGLLFGVPFLEGTTANAETFVALCTAAAVFAAFQGWTVPAGLLMAGAVLFKAVAGFDAVALGLFLLVSPYAGGHPDRWRAAVLYSISFAGTIGAAFYLSWRVGILGGLIRDALLYDLGYVGQGNGGGIPWLLVGKLAILIVLTSVFLRRPFPYLWLVWALAGTLVSGRVFGHYALQAVVPAAVSVIIAWRPERVGPLFSSILAACVAGAGLSALAGWLLIASGHNSILARRLQWYPNAIRFAAGSETPALYRSQVDDHVTRNLRIARDLRREPPGPVLIWGNIPWVYVLSGREPATAYTSAVRDPAVPGETQALRESIRGRNAEEVVVVNPPLPPLGPAARWLAKGYRVDAREGDAVLYVVRARQKGSRAR